VWLTWPRTGQLKLDSCSPNGALAEISAMTHGNGFWRVQLDDIEGQRNLAENWDRNQAAIAARLAPIFAQIDDALAKIASQMAEIYKKYPDLAPNQAHQSAEQLRALADAIELADTERMVSEQMRKRLPVLRRCDAKIRDRPG
jgi:hypothetical protein